MLRLVGVLRLVGAAQRDVNFRRCLESSHRVLVFVQCAHPVDLGRHRLFERRTNRARLGGASGFSHNTIGTPARVELKRLRQLLPASLIAFSYLYGHRRPRHGFQPRKAPERLSRIDTCSGIGQLLIFL
ncbi:MAG TPA: hypothetical protein VGK37_12485 [Casimicrobiaceae bacterium]